MMLMVMLSIILSMVLLFIFLRRDWRYWAKKEYKIFFETCAVEKYITGILSKNKEKATPVYDSILAYIEKMIRNNIAIFAEKFNV